MSKQVVNIDSQPFSMWAISLCGWGSLTDACLTSPQKDKCGCGVTAHIYLTHDHLYCATTLTWQKWWSHKKGELGTVRPR